MDWTSTPRDKRHRKPLEVTLSDEERGIADYLAEKHDAPKSRVVGAGLQQLSKLSANAQAEAVAKAKDDEEPPKRAARKARKK